MFSRFSRSFALTIFILVLITTLFMFHAPARTYIDPLTGELFGEGGVEKDVVPVPQKLAGVKGGVIMPKLGNETAKAALGQATWKLMHTMTLRFPEKPTEDERDALESYFRLQARLYPCGECAAEFQLLLQKFPPQTSSRRTASMWLCRVHNEVNARLGKSEFDCAHLDETYDCGCGDEPIGTARDERHSSDAEAEDASLDDIDEIDERDELTGAALIKGG